MMGHDNSAMTYSLNGSAPLTTLGVIRAEGADAAKFLHGQLTQDFALLGQDQARLAAFCNAKGRMQASFIGFKRSPTEILLICHRDLLAPTLKRLSMFVMRAQAKLSDATADFAVHGQIGEAAGTPQPAWSIATADDATTISLYPADGQARALRVAPVALPAPAGPALSEELWLWSEVRSGIATVSQPIFEALVQAARERGDVEVCLHAQTSAQGFYERLGFTPRGAVYAEVGIPHIEMFLDIR